MTKLIEGKTFDLKSKEAQLAELEGEAIQLQNQVHNFHNELNHLKALQEKYYNENHDLGKRLDSEGQRNVDLSTGIRDFEVKIKAREDQIMIL